MTTSRDVEHLKEVARSLGLQVVERKGPTRGGYHDGHKRIRLNPGQSWRVTRSFLAHEIGHALYRHVRSPYGPVMMKQERLAWEWAARYLVTPEAFAAAEDEWSGHAPAMAYELGVTVEIVDAFRRLLQRIDDTVYVGARMGDGQWTAKLEVA